MAYSVTYVDNCNGRWCWRTTATGMCSVQLVKECADRLFSQVVSITNSTPQ